MTDQAPGLTTQDKMWQIMWRKNKKPLIMRGLEFVIAVRTGLEPATPCVTGMYSNQLNYRTNILSERCAPDILQKRVQR